MPNNKPMVLTPLPRLKRLINRAVIDARKQTAEYYAQRLREELTISKTGDLSQSVSIIERDNHFYIVVGMEAVAWV